MNIFRFYVVPYFVMCDLERWPSVESTKSFTSYDRVPETIEYRVQIRDFLGNMLDAFKYKLKEGKELPCTVPLKGILYEFDQQKLLTIIRL